MQKTSHNTNQSLDNLKSFIFNGVVAGGIIVFTSAWLLGGSFFSSLDIFRLSGCFFGAMVIFSHLGLLKFRKWALISTLVSDVIFVAVYILFLLYFFIGAKSSTQVHVIMIILWIPLTLLCYFGITELFYLKRKHIWSYFK